jgi:FtsP/CotA-like multicopper oxidase with cupredoxin domain
VYEFTAKGPAVGMYHAHSDSQVQVPMGLAGAILIDDMPAPAGRSYDQRVQMVLTDAGNIGFGINGKAFPATEPIVAKVGETILVDYFNEGFQIHPMHLHGPQQTVIAKDGVPLTVPYSGDTIMIAPGERYSVLVTATRPGTWAFHCHILTHAEAPSGFFGMTTAMVVK